MNLEEIVCHPEQSCVIKDLGFDGISLFCWWHDFSKGGYGFIVEPYVNDERSRTRAYTVGELMLALKKGLKGPYIRVEPDDLGWNVTVLNEALSVECKDDIICSFNDENLAHCLADCLIWLLKNKHVKPEELKL